MQTVIVEVPRNLPLDDKILIAMRAARREHLEWWLSELDRHRGHRSFRPWTDVQQLQFGFSCGCSGRQEDFVIRVHHLKEALPEARETVLRMFRDGPGQRTTGRERAEHRRVQKRARGLLMRHLTREQKWHLRAHGFFKVTAKDGGSYEIWQRGSGNLRTEWKGHKLSLCVVPAAGHHVPVEDVMLYQKVLLETDPAAVLDPAYVQDTTEGVVYESGRFLRDGSEPVVFTVTRVRVPERVLDAPVEFMAEQMTAEVEAVEPVVERVETRET